MVKIYINKSLFHSFGQLMVT